MTRQKSEISDAVPSLYEVPVGLTAESAVPEEKISLVMVGLNHRTAPVSLRECFAMDAMSMKDMADRLLTEDNLDEIVLLSTCNRVEAYAATRQPQLAVQTIKKHFMAGRTVVTDDHTWLVLSDESVAAHLFSVTASLDSMVVGENQITGQVKDAYRISLDSGWTGPYLNRLFHRAFSVAKRVKTETEIAQGRVSIGSAGVMLAKKIFGTLESSCVVLLGAGEIGELVLRHLTQENVLKSYIINRSPEKAVALAAQGLGQAKTLEQLQNCLQQANILITSMTGQSEELTHLAFTRIMAERLNEPLFVIDLGVPRNVPASVSEVENIYLYNIDDLQGVADANKGKRGHEVVSAKIIIDEEVRLFYESLLGQDVVPMIAELNRKFDMMRQREVEKTLARMPHLDENDRRQIERLTQGLVSKILHDPIISLKQRRELSEPLVRGLIRKIFRLEDEE